MIHKLPKTRQEAIALHGHECWDCAWLPHCKEEATHWHYLYGELCPRHAAEVMKHHPKDKLERIL